MSYLPTLPEMSDLPALLVGLLGLLLLALSLLGLLPRLLVGAASLLPGPRARSMFTWIFGVIVFLFLASVGPKLLGLIVGTLLGQTK